MLARCYGPTGMKKRPDSRKLFERKNSNIHLQNDNFRILLTALLRCWEQAFFN